MSSYQRLPPQRRQAPDHQCIVETPRPNYNRPHAVNGHAGRNKNPGGPIAEYAKPGGAYDRAMYPWKLLNAAHGRGPARHR